MNRMISYIENETKKNCANKSWKEIVDTIIFPHMAGPNGTRWCIHDMFMNFMADFAAEAYQKDAYTGSAMLETALQRLSCGAVLHEATPWPEPLPKEYWDYSSKWDESHILTQGCFNFIMKGIETALKCEMTKDHALKILFGLMAYISPNGKVDHSYYAIGDFEKQATTLFHHASKLVEEYASYENIYKHYAMPGQWEKHIFWFSENQKKINWKNFFRETKSADTGNIFKRWKQRRAIKNKIMIAAMPKAR